MVNDKEDEITEELFQSCLCRCQIGIGFRTLMKASDFIFDCVDWLYCKCHTKNCKSGQSYKDFSAWKKNKKARINPIKRLNAFNMLYQSH